LKKLKYIEITSENKKSKNNELKIYREQFDKAIELVRNKL